MIPAPKGGRHRKQMNRIIQVATLSLAIASPAMARAATVTNLDDVDYTLAVTEGTTQSQVTVAAGESIEICSQGCFLTMPNGDREVLTGPEQLQIQDGRIKVQ